MVNKFTCKNLQVGGRKKSQKGQSNPNSFLIKLILMAQNHVRKTLIKSSKCENFRNKDHRQSRRLTKENFATNIVIKKNSSTRKPRTRSQINGSK